MSVCVAGSGADGMGADGMGAEVGRIYGGSCWWSAGRLPMRSPRSVGWAKVNRFSARPPMPAFFADASFPTAGVQRREVCRQMHRSARECPG